MQLGNGRWETFSYNDRQQIMQIGLGTTQTDQNHLKLEFKYHTTGQTNNNGSMLEQKITVPAVGSNSAFTAIQTYTYDSLNRIYSATETINSSQTWKQTFTIDRYGNRKFDAANTTTIGSCPTAVCNPSFPIDATNRNRFTDGQGYGYDANGNVTQDATGQRFGYDAENHQKTFFNSSNPGSTPDWTYAYDGDGRRVKKESATEITVFVYDATGKLVAEYASALAQTQEVSYLTTDHLGSPRITTNENGVVTNRKDFMAYGDEAISAQRVSGTTGNGYTPSDVRKDYTGYEKDMESGLEFAQARYYSSTQGRFSSVDPLDGSATIRDPQSFNRYSYVLNSPHKFTDPLGLLPVDSIACGQFCANSIGGYVDGSAFRGRDATFDWAKSDWFVQTETRVYRVIQSEADGRQATVTITITVTRSINRRTNQIGPDGEPTVSSDAVNTGRANFSDDALATIEAVTRDIAYVATKNKVDPTLPLAMAQRETHFGVGSIGDRRNIGKPEMAADINPLQLDGDANLKYHASASDRQYNIAMSLRLFTENATAARTTTPTDALSVYNSGKFANP